MSASLFRFSIRWNDAHFVLGSWLDHEKFATGALWRYCDVWIDSNDSTPNCPLLGVWMDSIILQWISITIICATDTHGVHFLALGSECNINYSYHSNHFHDNAHVQLLNSSIGQWPRTGFPFKREQTSAISQSGLHLLTTTPFGGLRKEQIFRVSHRQHRATNSQAEHERLPSTVLGRSRVSGSIRWWLLFVICTIGWHRSSGKFLIRWMQFIAVFPKSFVMPRLLRLH